MRPRGRVRGCFGGVTVLCAPSDRREPLSLIAAIVYLPAFSTSQGNNQQRGASYSAKNRDLLTMWETLPWHLPH